MQYNTPSLQTSKKDTNVNKPPHPVAITKEDVNKPFPDSILDSLVRDACTIGFSGPKSEYRERLLAWNTKQNALYAVLLLRTALHHGPATDLRPYLMKVVKGQEEIINGETGK